MKNLRRDRVARANRQLDDPGFESTVVAFQPILAGSHGSRFRGARAVGLLHSPDAGAEIVRFPARGLAPTVRPPLGHRAKSAAAALPHSTIGDDAYRHFMFINLLTSAWLAAVMTGGYFALSALVPMAVPATASAHRVDRSASR